MDLERLRAALRDPYVRRLRRDLGLATPTQIASGELSGPEEEARLRELSVVAVETAARFVADLRTEAERMCNMIAPVVAQLAAAMGIE